MKLVKVQMIHTMAAHDENEAGVMSPVKKYEEGEEYSVSETLAANMIISENAQEVVSSDDSSDEDNSNDVSLENSLLNVADEAASILNAQEVAPLNLVGDIDEENEDFGTADLDEENQEEKNKENEEDQNQSGE